MFAVINPRFTKPIDARPTEFFGRAAECRRDAGRPCADGRLRLGGSNTSAVPGSVAALPTPCAGGINDIRAGETPGLAELEIVPPAAEIVHAQTSAVLSPTPSATTYDCMAGKKRPVCPPRPEGEGPSTREPAGCGERKHDNQNVLEAHSCLTLYSCVKFLSREGFGDA